MFVHFQHDGHEPEVVIYHSPYHLSELSKHHIKVLALWIYTTTGGNKIKIGQILL